MEQPTGFTHLHVSGLPPDCDDAAVEAELRCALCKEKRKKQDADASPPVNIREADHSAEKEAAVGESASEEHQRLEKAAVVEGMPLEKDAAKDQHEAVADATEEPAEVVKPATLHSQASEEAVCTVAADAALVSALAACTLDADRIREEAVVAEQEEELEETEDPFTTCTVVRNKDTNACKGYCFLGFKTFVDAEKAMHILNAGVTVADSQIKAQISQPKERHAKAKDPTEDIGDLRLRRQRFQANGASKKKKMGHVTCSDKTARIVTSGRQHAGQINAVSGTRGGKIYSEDLKMSSRSGFASAK